MKAIDYGNCRFLFNNTIVKQLLLVCNRWWDLRSSGEQENGFLIDRKCPHINFTSLNHFLLCEKEKWTEQTLFKISS